MNTLAETLTRHELAEALSNLAPPLSLDWACLGPIVAEEHILLSVPESRVHRNGGPNAGWGESGLWSVTSFKMRRMDGDREAIYHETDPLLALARFVLACRSEHFGTKAAQKSGGA